MDTPNMDALLNSIVQGDCIAGMNSLPAESVDLAFADPPFNIGYEYDVYEDRRQANDYLDWSKEWMTAVHRVLKPDGTFWLAIGDEFAAELKVAAQQIGFHTRSWVIWYYTFGVNCKAKFSRSHAHLFYFTKDLKQFTFRVDDPNNRIPSARQLVYNDSRANPRGRLPDDTWIIRPADCIGELTADDGTWSPGDIPPPTDPDQTYTLRPQDLSERFSAEEDTWYFPRVAGTFKERAGFHGCQMPEQLLGRIIRYCSEENELVLDPFSGSATTLAVAKKLGRRYLGFELSEEYAKHGLKRLDSIRVGDPLDGSEEPTASAPPTKRGKATKSAAGETARRKQTKSKHYTFDDLNQTAKGIVQAYATTHDGYSADRLVADPRLNARFIECCNDLSLPGDPRVWNTLLFRLRKAGKLARIPTTKRTALNLSDCDQFLFASEIAWNRLLENAKAESLDAILCDPILSARFDDLAKKYAPGFTPLEYRWAALKIRKKASMARRNSEGIEHLRLGRFHDIFDVDIDKLPSQPAIYLVGRSTRIYAGETLNLRERFVQQFGDDRLDFWSSSLKATAIQYKLVDSNLDLAWQSWLVKKYRPKLNSSVFRTEQAA